MKGNSNPLSAMEQRVKNDKHSSELSCEMIEQNRAAELLGCLIQEKQYVGETLRTDYRNVTVQIHDHHRRVVQGIPHLSYLVATRIQQWKEPINWKDEDSSVMLLRVIGSAPMPSDMMDTVIRAEAARRATGTDSGHWEASQHMDAYTRYQLSFAGLACEVVGTFYLSSKVKNGSAELSLSFGTDISNFYPNSGLKVYKPIGAALEAVVNYRDENLTVRHELMHYKVKIGHVRYASTNRPMQGVDNVEVWIAPLDLLAQRTALFGMSRTGKSNTTKIISRSIYKLRSAGISGLNVGQLIFDYNGEYANENVQGGEDIEANALKNVWREDGRSKDEVVTYGLGKNQLDPDRRLLQINAYGSRIRDWKDSSLVVEDLDMLLVGKSILDDLLSEDKAKYVQNFCEVDLFPPDNLDDNSKKARYRRSILVYRALLAKAGLAPPKGAYPDVAGLFNQSLLSAMRNSPDSNRNSEYSISANILSQDKPTWDQVVIALGYLAEFIHDAQKSGYEAFNANYVQNSSKSGQSWADQNLTRMLEMFRYPNGSRSVAKLAQYHDSSNALDFAKQIYSDLKDGKLVIVDQSGGEPLLNDAAARRIMWEVFRGNQRAFTSGETPKDILIYVEEAHNLLPPSKSDDTKDIWVRTAKEGSKYRIGLIYATQEVSSIQKNILKNTANWFIAHLNNTDETRELKKFYDFANFEDSILRAQDRGFLRVKMLSNPYINPVQIERFMLTLSKQTS